MAYEERYCAFVDILGFSQLVRSLKSDTTQFEFLRRLLENVHNPASPRSCQYDDTDFQTSSISDAVAISTAAIPPGLSQLLLALEYLVVDLLAQGFFARGAVVKGFLYHKYPMVFGDALIDAYELEHRIARYPRIMITRRVADDYEENKKGDYDCISEIMQGNDGPKYLHVLREMEEYAHMPLDGHNPQLDKMVQGKMRQFEQVGRNIDSRLAQAIDNPRHFEKVLWFAKYWNESIERTNGPFSLIIGPGLAPKAAVWG
jgi:hypothetical protein